MNVRWKASYSKGCLRCRYLSRRHRFDRRDTGIWQRDVFTASFYSVAGDCTRSANKVSTRFSIAHPRPIRSYLVSRWHDLRRLARDSSMPYAKTTAPRWRFPAGAKVKHPAGGDRRRGLRDPRNRRHVPAFGRITAHNNVGCGSPPFCRGQRPPKSTLRYLGRTLILDAKTGSLLDSLPTEQLNFKVVNFPDRPALPGHDTGMLQCLREREQITPLMHQAPSEKKDDKAGKPAGSAGKRGDAAGGEKAAAPANDPFGAPAGQQ